MDSQFALIIILLLGLGVGTLLGWFFGSRPLADLRERLSSSDVEAKEQDEKFRRAIAELATLSANAANLMIRNAV